LLSFQVTAMRLLEVATAATAVGLVIAASAFVALHVSHTPMATLVRVLCKPIADLPRMSLVTCCGGDSVCDEF
jgi:hypothetical protein